MMCTDADSVCVCVPQVAVFVCVSMHVVNLIPHTHTQQQTVFSGTLSAKIMMFTASHAPSLTFWQTWKDCINKHFASRLEKFSAVIEETWKSDCHHVYDSLVQSEFQSQSDNPSVLRISSSSTPYTQTPTYTLGKLISRSWLWFIVTEAFLRS